MANPTVRQNNVRVQDLSGQRVHTARADGGTNVVIQPPYKVVVDIFRILVHVGHRCRIRVLVMHFDGVRDANVFERFIPRQDSFTDPPAITDRSGVLDVEL
ncbi:MAG TPA: hypothetical protein DCY79_18230, partial [Planctomycetaceae bacterium]|nr:hypothetical protein [Planctomycetaceae bacterium]